MTRRLLLPRIFKVIVHLQLSSCENNLLLSDTCWCALWILVFHWYDSSRIEYIWLFDACANESLWKCSFHIKINLYLIFQISNLNSNWDYIKDLKFIYHLLINAKETLYYSLFGLDLMIHYDNQTDIVPISLTIVWQAMAMTSLYYLVYSKWAILAHIYDMLISIWKLDNRDSVRSRAQYHPDFN